MNTHNNMGKTLASLVAGIPKADLRHLFVHPINPNVDNCDSYFRITDYEVLKSLVPFHGGKIGKQVVWRQSEHSVNDLDIEKKTTKKAYAIGEKRTSLIYLARNTMWRLSRWYTDELKSWIREFSPDVIFFAAGDYAFAYDIAYTIAKDFRIPIVMYICDDYFMNYRNPESLLGKPVHRDLMRSVKRCMKCTENLITICDKMSEAYASLFNKPVHTIYTGYSTKGEIYADGEGIVYLGNLWFERHKSLMDIGRALKAISEKTGKHYHLDVYSAETREEVLRDLTEENGIVFHGAVGSEEVNRIIAGSRLVVHTESLKPENVRKVQYSVSTKIADLLASGRCILAYGPENVASMEYLRDNGAACAVTDPRILETELEDILTNRERRERVIRAAKVLAEKNHNANMVAGQVKEIIDTSAGY